MTVLVPNYNHAPYLRQRLDSVFAQTYPHFEVILMDDCSTDDSRTILTEYADRHPDKARVMFNEVNSGGAFFQWEKGIRAAQGPVDLDRRKRRLVQPEFPGNPGAVLCQ